MHVLRLAWPELKLAHPGRTERHDVGNDHGKHNNIPDGGTPGAFSRSSWSHYYLERLLVRRIGVFGFPFFHFQPNKYRTRTLDYDLIALHPP